MKMNKNLCICGGGNLGQVIAGYIAAKKDVMVNVLTRKPDCWRQEMIVRLPGDETLVGKLNLVTDNAQEALKNVGIVLFCLPGNANKEELLKIKPYVSKDCFVGSVFCSTGFFFEAFEVLGKKQPLWGFQRVPFTARLVEYGKEAELKSFKPNYYIAVENTPLKEEFRSVVQELFDRPTTLLTNYYEATFTNSNPLFHTARLYQMFKDWEPGKFYPKSIGFHDDWDDATSDIYIQMDEDLMRLLSVLPVRKGYLPTILDYYESKDAASLTRKIKSIYANKGYGTPMIETEKGWIPDISSRYFQEEFRLSLKYVYDKAHELNVEIPVIDTVFNWGVKMLGYKNS